MSDTPYLPPMSDTPYLPPSEATAPAPMPRPIPPKDELTTEQQLAEISGKLDTIQAILMEIMEWKAEMENMVADFQPPNIMKMLGGLMGNRQQS